MVKKKTTPIPPKKYKFHPAANIFPLLEGAELEALANDIKANGLQEPIKLCGGKILDGRNRYNACLKVDAKPKYITITPDDPLTYVISENLLRRHLNESQRAMIAAEIKERYAKAAKERQKRRPKSAPPIMAGEKGDARDQAGEAMGVSHGSVDSASKVKNKGIQELQDVVMDGKLPVSTAAKIAGLTKAKQRKVVSADDPKKEAREHLTKRKPATDSKPVSFTQQKFDILLAVEKIKPNGLAAMFNSKGWDKSKTLDYLHLLHNLPHHLVRIESKGRAYLRLQKFKEAKALKEQKTKTVSARGPRRKTAKKGEGTQKG